MHQNNLSLSNNSSTCINCHKNIGHFSSLIYSYREDFMKQLSISLKALAVIFIIGLGLAILSSWLLISISSHKAEEKNSYAGIISPMTEEKYLQRLGC